MWMSSCSKSEHPTCRSQQALLWSLCHLSSCPQLPQQLAHKRDLPLHLKNLQKFPLFLVDKITLKFRDLSGVQPPDPQHLSDSFLLLSFLVLSLTVARVEVWLIKLQELTFFQAFANPWSQAIPQIWKAWGSVCWTTPS